MNISKNARGFHTLTHGRYLETHDEIRLAQESSAIGDYGNAMSSPGSSYLWIGDDLHLDRDEVFELVKRLQLWLDTGGLVARNWRRP